MLTIGQITEAVHGHLVGGSAQSKIMSVVIDSRQIKKGSLFVAIKGLKHDGHKFIKSAVRSGAVAVLVSKSVRLKGVPVIQVEDTTKALGEIAKCYRQKFRIPFIAVTGSAGKTTTKDLVAKVLSSRYKVLKNKGSENNWIGIPLTLFKLRKTHEIAVVELGTNQFGDIAWLAEMVQPDVAVLTNIGDSHLEGLKNKRGVFKEKSQLLKALKRNGTVVYNHDDLYLKEIPKFKQQIKKIGYSIDSRSSYQAKNVQPISPNKFRFTVRSKNYYISVPGRQHIYNALAAICCAQHFGVGYRNIYQAVIKFKPESNRGSIRKFGKYSVYDDTYNSNPLSFRLALDLIKNTAVKGRKIVVCGDMRELGMASNKLHHAMAKTIHQARIDLLLAYGNYSEQMVKELENMDSPVRRYHCKSHADIHRRLKSYCQSGDLILVKGSRAMHMEKTVQFIKNRLSP